MHMISIYLMCIQSCCSIIQYFEVNNWIKPSREVLKRKVNFTRNTDDAIAEICLADEATRDGNIIELAGNKKVC